MKTPMCQSQHNSESHLFWGSQFGPEIDGLFTLIREICMISLRLVKTEALRYGQTQRYLLKYLSYTFKFLESYAMQKYQDYLLGSTAITEVRSYTQQDQRTLCNPSLFWLVQFVAAKAQLCIWSGCWCSIRQHKKTLSLCFHWFKVFPHGKIIIIIRNYSTGIYRSVYLHQSVKPALQERTWASLTCTYDQERLRMKAKNNCILKDACISFLLCYYYTVQNTLSPSPSKSCSTFWNSCQKKKKKHFSRQVNFFSAG